MGIVKQLNKSIYLTNNKKSLKDLRLEYQSKYEEILKIKHDPTTSKYIQLKSELWDLLTKRELLAARG